MAVDVLVNKGEGNVDVQIGGPGRAWKYLSPYATMSGPSVPQGSTEIAWQQDPRKANGFRISSKFKTGIDQIGADVTVKLGKIDYLKGLDCPFSIRARYAKCGEREDPGNYDPLMLIYCDVDLGDYSYDDLVVADPGDRGEIIVTAPWQAQYELRIEKVNAGRIGSAALSGDQPINDIIIADSGSCGGYCGDRSDGCSIIYAVTDADASPYAAPNFIKIVKDNFSGGLTWTISAILGLNGNANAVAYGGSRIWVASNSDSVIAYNDQAGDQDEWNLVTLANAPTARHSALFARTAREVWVACANGYVYKSVDGGVSYTDVHPGTLTTETLNAVWAFDEDVAYAAGDNGVVIKTTDGGTTWTDLTEVATTAANILTIVVPAERSKDVFIGTNDGMVYRSTNGGTTFSLVSIDGEGTGTIDDIAFTGPCAGEVMYILHNDGGPRGRVIRDLSGGNGGADVETVIGYTQLIAAGVQLNSLAVCHANEAFAAGELNSSYPMIAKVV